VVRGCLGIDLLQPISVLSVNILAPLPGTEDEVIFPGIRQSSDLSLDGEQGIGIKLAVIIHLVTPWFVDST
jgi:hypothetical protein